MAEGVKISEMVAASLPLTGAERIELTQGGNTRGALLSAVMELASAENTAFDNDALTLLIATTVADAINELAMTERLVIRADYRTNTSAGGMQAYFAGDTISSIGTGAIQQPTGASLLTSMPRDRRTSAAASDSNAGHIFANATDEGFYQRTSGAAAGAGYHFDALVSLQSVKSNMRIYWMLYVGPSQPGGDSSGRLNFIGFCKDAGDTNLQFMRNDGSGGATKVDTGITLAQLTNQVSRVTISAPPDGLSATVRIALLGTATVFEQTVTTELPAADVRIGPCLLANTGSDGTTVAQEGIRASLRWNYFPVVL